MRNPKVETVRGVNDVLPPTYRLQKQIENQLSTCFQSFGYRPLDVPVIEYTELFLRKSGEELISRMYDFTYHNRRLCLRPELTASVARAYIQTTLQGEPLPVRLYYSGPVFRYEKPQRGRYRQFTQMGVEAIGAAGSMADAEMIALACQSLDKLGLKDYRVVLGNISLLNQFLRTMPLERRLGNFLQSQMEELRKVGRAALEAALEEICPPDNLVETPRLQHILQGLDEEEAKATILELLESTNVNLVGNRQKMEIANSLMGKIQRADQKPLWLKALDFMEQLAQLQGKPQEVLPSARQLLASYHMDSGSLAQLEEILAILPSYNIDSNRIMLDFGLSRGLQYYTGTIFEIHHETLGQERQLCGGGRYDDLVKTLGGNNDIPANGFSFGIERIRLAMESEGILPVVEERAVDALIVPLSAAEYSYSIEVGEKLRSKGLKVVLEVRGKNLSTSLKYAAKQTIPFVIVVGEAERLANVVVVKNMETRQQQQLPLEEAVMVMRRENDE